MSQMNPVHTSQPTLLKFTVMLLLHVDPWLSNDRGISKYTAAVLSNGFANKHVPIATIEVQQ
jgi:hypothetical protein